VAGFGLALRWNRKQEETMWDFGAKLMEGRLATEPYYLALNEAVMKAFPEVACETRHGFGLDFVTNTTFWKAGTNKERLSDYKAKQVHNFVRGFIAGQVAARTAPKPLEWWEKPRKVGDCIRIKVPGSSE
jgi:hypothetical protein